MNFLSQYQCYEWQTIRDQIYACDQTAVKAALHKKGKRSLRDFQALISPAAQPFLEEMAVLSQQFTQKRFGKTVQMYIPLYLSNECTNSCVYCGFNVTNPIERLTLSLDQVMDEIKVIKTLGFDHILLVTGEAGRSNVSYLAEVIAAIRPYFCNISLEVQPLEQADYEKLIALGLYAVYVYQETYGPGYADFHPRGKKRDKEYRLLTPDRLGQAGIHKIGLGCLIGLDDWRTDSWFTAAHLAYLEQTYWRTRFSISFPRIRPAAGSFSPSITISDRELVQLICSYRIFNENVELSISTRESENLRNHVFQLGITAISAGSKTYPGGYSLNRKALDQFQIEDQRSPGEVTAMIAANGYEPVWKDWFSRGPSR
jgi:2-iminoacetate synthase